MSKPRKQGTFSPSQRRTDTDTEVFRDPWAKARREREAENTEKAEKSDKPSDRPVRRKQSADAPRSFGENRSKGSGKSGSMSAKASSVQVFETRGEKTLPKWVPELTKLHRDKFREQENKFLAEGENVVSTIFATSPDLLIKVYLSEEFKNNDLLVSLEDAGKKIEILPSYIFREIQTTKTSPGIIALCQAAPLKPNWQTARTITLVDSVQDPGNLGAIFRTSLGFGQDAVVMGSGTVDPFNPKVVRGSSGSFLRMPFENRVDLAERINFLKGKGFTIVATSPHAKVTLSEAKLRRKVAFLVGNEGAGARQSYIDMADVCVAIPMAGELESLNVSVAHGVIAYELSKERS